MNLLPALQGETKPLDRALYWHFPYYHPEAGFAKSRGNRRERLRRQPNSPPLSHSQGAQKLLYFDEDQHSEQYNLSQDLNEAHDLSADETAAPQLKRELLHYLRRVDARFAVTSSLESTRP